MKTPTGSNRRYSHLGHDAQDRCYTSHKQRPIERASRTGEASKTSICSQTFQAQPGPQSSVGTRPSGDRSGSGLPLSASDDTFSSENSSEDEFESDEEMTQPTVSAKEEGKTHLSPAVSLGEMIKRRRVELRSRSPCNSLPAEVSQSSQESDCLHSFPRRTLSTILSNSDVGTSESSDLDIDVDTRQATPVAKKRRRRLSSSSLSSPPKHARNSNYRPIEPVATPSTFKSLFRHPESSQSSQECKRPRAQPASKTGCVYVLHDDETNHVKIGISRSAASRHKALKGDAANPTLPSNGTQGIAYRGFNFSASRRSSIGI